MWRTWNVAARAPLGEGLDRGQVDRAGALAAAEDQQAAVVGGDPEALAAPRRGRRRATAAGTGRPVTR